MADKAISKLRVLPNRPGPGILLQPGEGTVGICWNATEGRSSAGGTIWILAADVPEFCRLLEEVAAMATHYEKTLRDNENGTADGR